MGDNVGAALSPAPAAGEVAIIPGLETVRGLPALMAHLSSSAQTLALRWCQQEDADSVAVIVLAERTDAFVRALGFKAGGCNETVVRRRLASLQ